jgi:hypothetical protein
MAEIPPHLQRVIEEEHDLWLRIGKLILFIAGDTFKGLPEIERMAMDVQLRCMQNYKAALQIRLSMHGLLGEIKH